MTPPPPPRRSTRKPIPHVSKCARDRAIAAHGRDLTRPEWTRVVEAILKGTATVLSRSERDGYTVFAIPLDAFTVRVVWRPATAMIVTTQRWGEANHRQVAKSQAGPLRSGKPRPARGRRDEADEEG